MPLPIAHGFVGASLCKAWPKRHLVVDSKKLLLIAAFISIAPDFDFVFVWILRWGWYWHRGFSHSLAFAFVLGLAGCAMARSLVPSSFLVFSSAALTHGLLDFLTTRHAMGVELFWPISNHRFAAGLIDYLDFYFNRKPRIEFLAGVAGVLLFELLFFGSTFLMILSFRNAHHESD